MALAGAEGCQSCPSAAEHAVCCQARSPPELWTLLQLRPGLRCCGLQDPTAQAEVAHARLLLQQEAARARLHKQLRVVDADSLAECHRLATSAQLGQDILGQVQELQAAAQLLLAAVDAVQAHQQQQQDATTGVPAGAHAGLAASLHKIEEHLVRKGSRPGITTSTCP